MAFPWVVQQIKDILSKLGNKADLISPIFTGIPQAPTAIINTNSDQLATTAFAHSMENARYGTCVTAAATAAKVGDVANFVRKTGSIVGIKFTYANSASSPTLNVNNTGAAYIYHKGTYITTDMIPAGHVALFQFNGAQWELLNPVAGVGGASARVVITSSSTWIAPRDGIYTFVLIGGGGGGGGGVNLATFGGWGGPGGGGGGMIHTLFLSAGTSVSIVIGAGGAGGALVTAAPSVPGYGGGQTSITVSGVVYTSGGGGGGGGGVVLNSNTIYPYGSGGGGGGGGLSGKGSDGAAGSSSIAGKGGGLFYIINPQLNGSIVTSETEYTRRVYTGGGEGGAGGGSTTNEIGSLDGQVGLYSTGGTQIARKRDDVATWPLANQSVPGACVLAPGLGNPNYGKGGNAGVGKSTTLVAPTAGGAGTAGAVGIFY